MILLTLLAIVLAVIAAVIVLTTGLVGGALAVVFGDVIVFGLVVMLIVKIFRKKK